MSVLMDPVIACGITCEDDGSWHAWIGVGGDGCASHAGFESLGAAFRWIEECYAGWKSVAAA